MSTPIDPNAPTFEQRALKTIHEQDETAYATLFGSNGEGNYLHKARVLGKSLAYLQGLQRRGLITIHKEGNHDAKAYLTEKGKAEIGG